MPVQSASEAPPQILKAISKASKATGMDFGYLLKTASRESSFDQNAAAKSSSAQGLYQFLEGTWLGTVKEEGARFGLEKYAEKILRTSNGDYHVPDKAARKQILELRNDPEISATMAAAHSQKNAQILSQKLGRAPTQGELYVAHFLGATNAARLIDLQSTRPNIAAEAVFGAAASANPAIFGSGDSAKTVREVYRSLTEGYGATKTSVARNESAQDLNQPVGPLISKAAIAPLRYLFTRPTESGKENGPAPERSSASALNNPASANSSAIWSTHFHNSGATLPPPIGGIDPLAWAAGRWPDDGQSAEHEAWVGENGWKLTVTWNDPGADRLGTIKNFKA